MSVNAEVSYSIQGDNQTYTGKCKDLSHTGISFISENALTEGQTLDVTIDSKNSNYEPMKASVEVIRVKLISDKYDVGCKILKFA